jgi:acetyl-CoA synthetase
MIGASSPPPSFLRHVRTRLAAHAYPREIEFIDELPKTLGGKVQRFLLRRR